VTVLQPFAVVDHRGHSGFDAVVIAIDHSMLADFAVVEANGLKFSDEEFDILTQRASVALQCQNVMGLLVDDLTPDYSLSPLMGRFAETLSNC